MSASLDWSCQEKAQRPPGGTRRWRKTLGAPGKAEERAALLDDAGGVVEVAGDQEAGGDRGVVEETQGARDPGQQQQQRGGAGDLPGKGARLPGDEHDQRLLLQGGGHVTSGVCLWDLPGKQPTGLPTPPQPPRRSRRRHQEAEEEEQETRSKEKQVLASLLFCGFCLLLCLLLAIGAYRSKLRQDQLTEQVVQLRKQLQKVETSLEEVLSRLRERGEMENDEEGLDVGVSRTRRETRRRREEGQDDEEEEEPTERRRRDNSRKRRSKRCRPCPSERGSVDHLEGYKTIYGPGHRDYGGASILTDLQQDYEEDYGGASVRKQDMFRHWNHTEMNPQRHGNRYNRTTGMLTIHNSGTYWVYAQVMFFNSVVTNGISITLVRHNDDHDDDDHGAPQRRRRREEALAICQISTDYNDPRASDRGNAKYKTCYTARAVQLRQGDRIGIKNTYPGRSVIFQKAASYWGLVQLNSHAP